MLFNLYNYLLWLMTFLGTFMVASADSWLMMWMGLEVNMISFISLMMIKATKYLIESGMKYFMIQVLGSLLMMMLTILEWYSGFFMSYLYIPLLMKLGIFPFHYWVLDVNMSLGLVNSIVMLTWQKLAPLILMEIFWMSETIFFIIVALGFTVVISLGHIILQKMIAMSSVYHLCWIMCALLSNLNSMILYFSFYSMLLFFLLNYIMKNYNLNNMKIFMLDLKSSLIFMFLIFIFMGVPPFVGFYLKWNILSMIWDKGFIFMSLALVVSTLFNLFMYSRFLYFSSFLNMGEWMLKVNMKSFFYTLMLIMGVSMVIPLMN